MKNIKVIIDFNIEEKFFNSKEFKKFKKDITSKDFINDLKNSTITTRDLNIKIIQK